MTSVGLLRSAYANDNRSTFQNVIVLCSIFVLGWNHVRLNQNHFVILAELYMEIVVLDLTADD